MKKNKLGKKAHDSKGNSKMADEIIILTSQKT